MPKFCATCHHDKLSHMVGYPTNCLRCECTEYKPEEKDMAEGDVPAPEGAPTGEATELVVVWSKVSGKSRVTLKDGTLVANVRTIEVKEAPRAGEGSSGPVARVATITVTNPEVRLYG